jgi:hypothetical protein
MRLAAALFLFAIFQAPARVAPEPRHFQFERGIAIHPGTTGKVCAPLDAPAYEHSAALTDVRLYAGSQEVPYALLTSQVAPSGDTARVLNLGQHNGHIVFDLEMPSRPYSSVNLKLRGQDFLATATISGLQSLGGTTCCGTGVALGTFTLFDLAAQHLGRSTALNLAESTFPYLHVELAANAAAGHPGFSASPSMVEGAYVPPSREAQTIYTTVAETTNVSASGRTTVAVFDVPPHVPVERVLFELNPGDKTNFSRSVTVTATAKAETDRRAFDEVVSGDISRVRMTSGGKEIHEEDLGITAILGSNARSAMTIKVAIENGDDKPLPIHAVKLQMRERKLCFDAPNEPVTMFYGDDKLVAPVYDYSRIFRPEEASAVATLEPEQPNPTYAARADQRSLTERHPELLWVSLVAVVLVLGVVAFRSARRVSGPHS